MIKTASPRSSRPAPAHCSSHEKIKFDRNPRINLVPFISSLLKDACQISQAIRDAWSAVQNVLHSAISKQQLTAAATQHSATRSLPPSHTTVSHSHFGAFRSLCLSFRALPCLTTHVWPVAKCFSGVAVLVVVIVADHSSLPRSAGCRTRCPVVHLARSSQHTCDLIPPTGAARPPRPAACAASAPYHTDTRDSAGTPPMSLDLSGTFPAQRTVDCSDPPGIPPPPSRTVFLDEPDTHVFIPPIPRLSHSSGRQKDYITYLFSFLN